MNFSTFVKIGFGLGFGYTLGTFCGGFTASFLATTTANGLSKLADVLTDEDEEE